jgi:hypothetical protein
MPAALTAPKILAKLTWGLDTAPIETTAQHEEAARQLDYLKGSTHRWSPADGRLTEQVNGVSVQQARDRIRAKMREAVTAGRASRRSKHQKALSDAAVVAEAQEQAAEASERKNERVLRAVAKLLAEKDSIAKAAVAGLHNNLQLAKELHAGVPDVELPEEADDTECKTKRRRIHAPVTQKPATVEQESAVGLGLEHSEPNKVSCRTQAPEPATNRRSTADHEARDMFRFDWRRYDELFEETHRVVAQHNGPALKIDKDGCVSSSLQEAKRFTDWWIQLAPDYKTITTRPLDERLIHERLNAWSDACMDRFPEIETIYIAERNVMERQGLEAQGVEFSCPRGQAWARKELLFDEVPALAQQPS